MIPAAARRELEARLGERLQLDAPLSRHTSLRVGGPAEALVAPESLAELHWLLSWCARHHIPHTLLGGGFNTLVLDGGVEGLVVRTQRLRRLAAHPDGTVLAEAGVSHSQITRLCTRHGLSGLEFGAGIPGTVGGWLAMNAGVPEREMRDALIEIEVVSPTGSVRRRLAADRLRFVYRGLRGLAPGSVLYAARFGLTRSTPEAVRGLVERMLSRRRDTQPLDVPSCGSVFKNPRGDHAGRLIELAGLKGERVGGAEISSVHANFIVNRGGARAADVLALIERARQRVLELTGIRLEPEVRILGRPA